MSHIQQIMIEHFAKNSGPRALGQAAEGNKTMHIVQAIGAHLEKLGHTLVPLAISINYPRVDTTTNIIYFNECTGTIRVRVRGPISHDGFVEFSLSDPLLLQKVADACESARQTI